MATQAVNTKIDMAVEAIEALAIAAARPFTEGTTEARYEDVLAARANASAAFRELLQPTLRVIEGEKGRIKLRDHP
jgi:hypothetical protein